jgi:hypothetical protein
MEKKINKAFALKNIETCLKHSKIASLVLAWSGGKRLALAWPCALDLVTTGWDGMLFGHKLCDSDLIYGGDAGTRIDARIVPNEFPVLRGSRCANPDKPIRKSEWKVARKSRSHP